MCNSRNARKENITESLRRKASFKNVFIQCKAHKRSVLTVANDKHNAKRGSLWQCATFAAKMSRQPRLGEANTVLNKNPAVQCLQRMSALFEFMNEADVAFFYDSIPDISVLT